MKDSKNKLSVPLVSIEFVKFIKTNFKHLLIVKSDLCKRLCDDFRQGDLHRDGLGFNEKDYN